MARAFRIFAIGLLFSILWGCASSNEFTSVGIDLSKYQRIAVLPFYDYPTLPGSGTIVADLVTTKLHASGFNIVDRMQTWRVLQEQGLGQTGAVDEATAPVVGKILGVQAFLSGAITKYQVVYQADRAYAALDATSLGLTLKLIDSETSQIVWSGSAEGMQLGLNTEIDAANHAIGSIVKKLQKRIVLSSNKSSVSATPLPITKSNVEPREIQRDTLLPNFRSRVSGVRNLSDEEILEAYRKKFPSLQDVSDIKLIKMIEAKYSK